MDEDGDECFTEWIDRVDQLELRLRKIERNNYLKKESIKKWSETLEETSRQREKFEEETEVLNNERSQLERSIQEKESFILSSESLQKIVEEEIRRLREILHNNAKKNDDLLGEMKKNEAEMKESLAAYFGPELVKDTPSRADELREKIKKALTVGEERKKELQDLEPELAVLERKSFLREEKEKLLSAIAELNKKKSSLQLQLKMKEVKKTPIITPGILNSSISLEASVCSGYPKLTDGSSFFEHCMSKMKKSVGEKGHSSKKILDSDCVLPQMLNTPSNSERMIVSSESHNAIDDEVMKARRSISFENKSSEGKSPYFSRTEKISQNIGKFPFKENEEHKSLSENDSCAEGSTNEDDFERFSTHEDNSINQKEVDAFHFGSDDDYDDPNNNGNNSFCWAFDKNKTDNNFEDGDFFKSKEGSDRKTVRSDFFK